ncbi:MAG TPA: class I SAM-dependent methyltransferase [Ohtaekwangia sp.]|nr:class I SAM-dependent methyltransferase [Ohtaekwangia sp.]
MEHGIAVNLIKGGVPLKKEPVRWADLGAGTGVFTSALAELIAVSSGTIYAVDENEDALRQIANVPLSIDLVKLSLNFVHAEIPLFELDGIIMANSFHFVLHKAALLSKLKTSMKKDAVMIVVEYDVASPSKWIPYPLNFQYLQKIVMENGFKTCAKIGEMPSKYGNNKLYSAVVR